MRRQYFATISNAFTVFLAQAVNLTHAKANCRPARISGGLQRAVPIGVIDVDGADLNAMFAGVTHQLGRVQGWRPAADLGVSDGVGDDTYPDLR